MKIRILYLILLFCSFASAQTDKEKALDLGKQAIKIMDEGQLDESIDLLQQAQKLDPARFDYPYEIAYANYRKQDYLATIYILEKLTTHKDVSDYLYQLLGNSYDLIGKPDKAIEVYQSGITRFPHSGKLYTELGVVEHDRKEFHKAVEYWEKGTKAEPNYASNYYKLAKTYNNSEERVWTLFYAELFMNLEAGTDRTREMSKLLYKNYKLTYEVKNDTSGEYKLTKTGVVVDFSDKKEYKRFAKKGILPFEGTFAMAYMMGSIDSQNFDSIKRFSAIRTRFLDYWFDQKKFDRIYPNKLLSFQRKVQELGLLEAYNYWLLSEGNPEEFDQWYNTHQAQYQKFADWFKTISLDLREKDKYARCDYN